MPLLALLKHVQGPPWRLRLQEGQRDFLVLGQLGLDKLEGGCLVDGLHFVLLVEARDQTVLAKLIVADASSIGLGGAQSCSFREPAVRVAGVDALHLFPH